MDMPSSSSTRHLLAVAVISSIAVVICGPVPAGADDAASARVVVAPDVQSFEGQLDSTEDAQRLRRAIRRGASESWEQVPGGQLEVVTPRRLEETIVEEPLYEGTLQLARDLGQLGIDAYKQVRTDEAVDYLERSLDNFEQISHDFVDPGEVAEIQLYLALSYLEDGTDVVRPIELFQQMIRLDPSRHIQRGYYPDFIVQYYEQGRDRLFEELLERGPSGDQADRIAQLADSRYVFHGYALPRAEREIELVGYLYDATEQQLREVERLTLAEVDEGRLEEGFSRLASRLATCLIEDGSDDSPGDSPRGAPAGAPGGNLSMQLGTSYGTFLEIPDPIEDPFGNYGLTLGAGWAVTPEFQVVAQLQISNSMRDYSGVLRDNFTTIRGSIVGELGRRFGALYIGGAVGFEGLRTGTIRAFTDRSCIPDPQRLCPGDTGTAVFDDRQPHWGVRLQPTVGWGLSDSFELVSTAGVGYYFSPLEDRLLNFPVNAELGLRYRF